MPSIQPLISNAVNESQKLFDMAKTIMQIPKPNTAKNNFFPWPYLKGKMVSSVTVIIEPISLAAFNMPKPSGKRPKNFLGFKNRPQAFFYTLPGRCSFAGKNRFG